MFARTMLIGMTGLLANWAASPVRADPHRLSEPSTDTRTFQVESEVITKGKLITPAAGGTSTDLPFESGAKFRFRERRLASAGRDALALRAVREFEMAMMKANIREEETGLSLPPKSAPIVACGEREGILNYSTRTLLTRDQVDLLDMPGDPLALLSLLPDAPTEVGAEWKVPEWASQMLTGVEAVETAEMTARFREAEKDVALIEFQGSVKGLREGASSIVGLSGSLQYSLRDGYLMGAAVNYTVQADAGAVSPGIDAVIIVKLQRRITEDPGQLSDALTASLPLEPPSAALKLVFNAGPWNVRLRHSRDWYIFHAILESPPNVAILRLVEQGSLVCQCNMSPIPDAAAGSHTPLTQYESDIRESLGDAFRAIKSRDVQKIDGGRTVVSVVALGETRVAGDINAVAIPMEWHYYLCADPHGRQVSFVFALEPSLAEQLGGRDRELVSNLEFLPFR